jgi:hypothetical protein
MALAERSGVNELLTNTKLGKGAQNKLGEGKTYKARWGEL